MIRNIIVLLLALVPSTLASELYHLELVGAQYSAEIDANKDDIYQQLRGVFVEHFGSFVPVEPGESIRVGTTRNLRETQRELNKVKICPKNCVKTKGYTWCYLNGCVCAGCGRRLQSNKKLKKADIDEVQAAMGEVLKPYINEYGVDLAVILSDVKSNNGNGNGNNK